jgi:glycosyltransferase involved in cell wall biosynthesis
MLDPYFQKAKGRKLKAIRNVIYWQLIENKLINQADGLLFTCEEERRLAREPFRPYRPKRELVVGLGVEEPPPFKSEMRDAFAKICPEIQSRPYILFLSRIHEKKGTDILVKAYLEVIKRSEREMSEFPLLVIAGPGLDTPFGKLVQSMVSQSPMRDSIVFPGMLINESKWGAFHGCDAFVLPSHQENFGIAVVEALACRKPVLITNQINIWREIQEGGGGIVNENTVEGTTASLEKWIALSKSQKSDMSALARKVYESTFSVSRASHSISVAVQT